jgi:hypothetical protein
MIIHLERWKSLLGRYEQDRPHRMLALDGGGIRGLIALGILKKDRRTRRRLNRVEAVRIFRLHRWHQHWSDYCSRPFARYDDFGTY